MTFCHFFKQIPWLFQAWKTKTIFNDFSRTFPGRRNPELCLNHNSWTELIVCYNKSWDLTSSSLGCGTGDYKFSPGKPVKGAMASWCRYQDISQQLHKTSTQTAHGAMFASILHPLGGLLQWLYIPTLQLCYSSCCRLLSVISLRVGGSTQMGRSWSTGD